MKEIAAMITSTDVDVLQQSLAFVQERSARESERGKTAETRATAILAILGIMSGFIIPFTERVSSSIGDVKWTLLVLLLGSLLFLVKGMYYAARVIGVTKQYRIEVESVFEFQGLSRVDALREEIAGLVWECEQSIKPNTLKLFWLHRSQRSVLIAILFFLVLGAMLLIAGENWLDVPIWIAIHVGGAAVLLFCLSDILAERIGIWRKDVSSQTTLQG